MYPYTYIYIYRYIYIVYLIYMSIDIYIYRDRCLSSYLEHKLSDTEMEQAAHEGQQAKEQR